MGSPRLVAIVAILIHVYYDIDNTSMLTYMGYELIEAAWVVMRSVLQLRTAAVGRREVPIYCD